MGSLLLFPIPILLLLAIATPTLQLEGCLYDIVFLIDRSVNVVRENKLDTVITGLQDVIHILPLGTKITVLYYAGDVTLKAKPTVLNSEKQRRLLINELRNSSDVKHDLPDVIKALQQTRLKYFKEVRKDAKPFLVLITVGKLLNETVIGRNVSEVNSEKSEGDAQNNNTNVAKSEERTQNNTENVLEKRAAGHSDSPNRNTTSSNATTTAATTAKTNSTKKASVAKSKRIDIAIRKEVSEYNEAHIPRAVIGIAKDSEKKKLDASIQSICDTAKSDDENTKTETYCVVSERFSPAELTKTGNLGKCISNALAEVQKNVTNTTNQ
ncbi:uncharacterized protein LOC141913116 [Tubulanus polymorphus]|uniref:uncharacterized protein LOC141913116 n=1 Tax=Tubulanus polymorphus TaxID=672921 RepID=UPI003DA50743